MIWPITSENKCNFYFFLCGQCDFTLRSGRATTDEQERQFAGQFLDTGVERLSERERPVIIRIAKENNIARAR
jgi:hypothetical protein